MPQPGCSFACAAAAAVAVHRLHCLLCCSLCTGSPHLGKRRNAHVHFGLALPCAIILCVLSCRIHLSLTTRGGVVVSKQECGHGCKLDDPGRACNPGSNICTARLVRAALGALLGFVLLLVFVRAACASAPPPGGGDAFLGNATPILAAVCRWIAREWRCPQGDARYAQGIAAASPGGLAGRAGLRCGSDRCSTALGDCTAIRDCCAWRGLTHTVALTGLFGFIDDLFTQVSVFRMAHRGPARQCHIPWRCYPRTRAEAGQWRPGSQSEAHERSACVRVGGHCPPLTSRVAA